jgi:hypothetical protein
MHYHLLNNSLHIPLKKKIDFRGWRAKAEEFIDRQQVSNRPELRLRLQRRQPALDKRTPSC